MDKGEFGEWVRVALSCALRENWEGPIPAIAGSSLKMGLLFERVDFRVPRFWLEEPTSLAARLAGDCPEIVEKLRSFDPIAFGFVVRTRLHILESRGLQRTGRS